MKLENSIALVTGAGRGIGKSVSLTLARAGAIVVVTSRTQNELDQLKREIVAAGGQAHAIRADLHDAASIRSLFEEIRSRFGRLDLLVNNAGIGIFSPVRDLDAGAFDRMWSLNMKAAFLCTQEALRFMEPQKGGAIVNVASLAGKNSFIGGAGYGATKWALIGFARSLMLEVREFNIRVVTICPGSVDTSFSPNKSDPSRSEKILHPQDVADAILGALLMPDRAMVSEIDIRPTNPK